MSDSYTEIMDSVRAKCPDCADKLAEIHRLLHKINNSPTKEQVLEVIAVMTRYYCASAEGDYDAGMESGDGDYINADDTLKAMAALYGDETKTTR